MGISWRGRHGAIGIGAVLLATLAGCGSSAASDDAAEDSSGDTVTVTDAAGHQVSVDLPVGAVAILDRGPAEILSAFGMMDNLVGIHQSLEGDPLYPEVQDRPVVATWSEVNFEALAMAEPDVVLTSVEGGHGAITDDQHLQTFDIVDVKTNLRDPRTMSEEILNLGTLFGQEDKAQELVDFYAEYEGLIEERIANIPEDQRPKVFLQTHPGLLHTGGGDSAWHQQIPLAGGINISEELSGQVQVDAEWLAGENPDVIIVEGSTLGPAAADAADTDAPALREEVLNAGGIKDTTAVANGDVYVLPIDIVSRPGYIVGEIHLAKIFYPELFADLDPEQVHQEYLDLFHPGTERTGTWIHPELP